MNLLYAQSGGVTAVINASAAGVIDAARKHAAIGKVFAARHGILGLLDEALYDTAGVDTAALLNTPGGAFGSCRFDLPSEADEPAVYDRLFAVLQAYRIGGLLYNGGNGSMDLIVKVAESARRRGYPLISVGVPKTVDNDIEGSDCCPGFGSAAKYLATSMREAGRDVAAMTGRSGRVFVMEVMGRNVGWLAASTALAARSADEAPHIVLMPEVAFDEEAFLARVRQVVERLGYCAVTVAEGLKGADGRPLMEQARDARGYVQLGGAGEEVARLIGERLGYKHHYGNPDYLQRAAGHWMSATDREQAYAVGAAGVELLMAGQDGVMAAIRRLSDQPYCWDVIAVQAASIANLERRVPRAFISDDGLHVSELGRRYLLPLIAGEIAVPCTDGLPDHYIMDFPLMPRLLPDFRRSA
ncbi:6-phosphofructokinase [Parazoarcus communis]|uniref:Pyrophosphate--fructose 6-phosphate 1-phosphotransferase n=1 Tax=Parazoarcus communis SWub3 = DSM 12120 TaxID=1121029 RepID=A0A323UTF5_9RHOO|nr:6-phosphofructokinase [Parazoarcus communis]NMG70563.1 diphosphate--fructose-6-phosphate 1-phosphotransferase [Parazoarcus communis SWub3 = DSM 12120]PZA15779.1 diphosphate--fructose-6-phosphate 1-phosphotransferase [Azoarcus communis] [Parazoarcus communis SWub3 = DSM 12120]